MGLLVSYFAAASDELAASTIDWLGGPERGEKKRPFRKTQPGFDAIDGQKIEPVVQLGMFEHLLTGRSFDAQLDDPLSRPILAERDHGERLVLGIDDRFVAQLAAVDSNQLTELALPWSQIEEFWGMYSVDDLSEFLKALRGLAHRAVESSRHLYCWLVV